MAPTKAYTNNVGESLKDDDIKESKAAKENNSYIFFATSVEHISCIKKVYLTMFLIFTTIEQSGIFS